MLHLRSATWPVSSLNDSSVSDENMCSSDVIHGQDLDLRCLLDSGKRKFDLVIKGELSIE